MGGGFTETCNDFSMCISESGHIYTSNVRTMPCKMLYSYASLCTEMPICRWICQTVWLSLSRSLRVQNQLKYMEQLNFNSVPDVISLHFPVGRTICQPPFSLYFTYYHFNVIAVGAGSSADIQDLNAMHTHTLVHTGNGTQTTSSYSGLPIYGNATVSMNGLSQQQTRMAGFLIIKSSYLA